MNKHSISYDENKNYILVECYGPVSDEDATEIRKQSIDLAEKHNCTKSITDFRQASLELSTFETYELPRVASQDFMEKGMRVHDQKIAFVANINLQTVRFLEVVAQNLGHNVKIFYSQDAARAWLFTE